jgi:hypothetical protein
MFSREVETVESHERLYNLTELHLSFIYFPAFKRCGILQLYVAQGLRHQPDSPAYARYLLMFQLLVPTPSTIM